MLSVAIDNYGDQRIIEKLLKSIKKKDFKTVIRQYDAIKSKNEKEEHYDVYQNARNEIKNKRALLEAKKLLKNNNSRGYELLDKINDKSTYFKEAKDLLSKKDKWLDKKMYEIISFFKKSDMFKYR